MKREREKKDELKKESKRKSDIMTQITQIEYERGGGTKRDRKRQEEAEGKTKKKEQQKR